MPSKKTSGADNQQERLKFIGWIIGFVDGEGCFTVSFFKHPKSRLRLKWEVFPEFVITQGEKSLPALKIFKKYFQGGNIYVNKRYDNHKENIYRYCLRSISELNNKIIPFFENHHLRTYKNNDFVIFAKIVRMMVEGKHQSAKGAIKIAKLVEKMNRKKKSRFLKSSETIR